MASQPGNESLNDCTRNRARSPSAAAAPRPAHHFAIHIHQLNDSRFRLLQYRLGQRARPGTEIEHPFGLDPGDFLRSAPQHGFVAGNKPTNRRIVGIDVKLADAGERNGSYAPV